MRLKKILLAVAGVVAVVVLAVLGIAATKPDAFHIERSATLSAPAEAVFPHLEDFKRWGGWSPYEKVDPNLKRTFSGPQRGPGSTYAYEGTQIGAGRMTILESRPNEQLTIKLEFLKPFESTSTATFILKPLADGTQVTWAMDGENTFMGKVMSVLVDMDEMIGKDFAAGLANLNQLTEGNAVAAAK